MLLIFEQQRANKLQTNYKQRANKLQTKGEQITNKGRTNYKRTTSVMWSRKLYWEWVKKLEDRLPIFVMVILP
jgi:hypothetical protein